MKYIRISADNLGAIYSVPDEYADHLTQYTHKFLDWLEQSKQAKQYRTAMPNGAVMLCYSERDFADYLQRKCHQCTLICDLDAGGIDLDFPTLDTPPEFIGIPSINF